MGLVVVVVDEVELWGKKEKEKTVCNVQMSKTILCSLCSTLVSLVNGQPSVECLVHF